jgi:hypothetical protein
VSLPPCLVPRLLLRWGFQRRLNFEPLRAQLLAHYLYVFLMDALANVHNEKTYLRVANLSLLLFWLLVHWLLVMLLPCH